LYSKNIENKLVMSLSSSIIIILLFLVDNEHTSLLYYSIYYIRVEDNN
jgi:hypothetical protein